MQVKRLWKAAVRAELCFTRSLLEHYIKIKFMKSQISVMNAAKFFDFSVSFRARFFSH